MDAARLALSGLALALAASGCVKTYGAATVRPGAPEREQLEGVREPAIEWEFDATSGLLTLRARTHVLEIARERDVSLTVTPWTRRMGLADSTDPSRWGTGSVLTDLIANGFVIPAAGLHGLFLTITGGLSGADEEATPGPWRETGRTVTASEPLAPATLSLRSPDPPPFTLAPAGGESPLPRAGEGGPARAFTLEADAEGAARVLIRPIGPFALPGAAAALGRPFARDRAAEAAVVTSALRVEIAPERARIEVPIPLLDYAGPIDRALAERTGAIVLQAVDEESRFPVRGAQARLFAAKGDGGAVADLLGMARGPMAAWTAARIAETFGGRAPVATGADGRASLRAFLPYRYEIVVLAEGYEPLRAEPARYDSGGPELTLFLKRRTPEAPIP